MPELPEIEVVCRGLAPHLKNRVIAGVWYSGKKLRHDFDLELAKKTIINQEVISVKRRARYLVIQIGRHSLVVHLGMTGNLGIFPAASKKLRHTHIILTLDNDMELRFSDTRRFGSVQLFENSSFESLEQTFFQKFGPEPFDAECTPYYLHEKAKKRKIAVKNLIMDNQIITGTGNIYANESLFQAGIKPGRKACSITLREWEKLHQAIVEILLWAIDCGGSTISDFIDASGSKGYFQANFRVYGRAKQPCPNCNTPITSEKIGGRSSFYCRKCQK